MTNFYDEWLNLWDKGVTERKRARKSIHPEELKWENTRQDYKAALQIAPETGFRTLGSVTMVAEIPPGWKTGKHKHGEEAMYILEGNGGFSVIDGKRYDWEKGACVRIPFGSTHQHFNNGDVPVKYLSALAPHFEHFCGIARFEQFEDCGKFTSLDQYGKTSGDHDEKGRRLVLRERDASVGTPGEEKVRAKTDAFSESFASQMFKVQSSKNVKFMGFYDDFQGELVEITDVFVKKPRSISVKHAHMEAILYILQGEGYSIVDGEKLPWKAGTAVHVQGPQTVHQHFTTGNTDSQQLRVHFGVRKFVQPIAKDVFPYLYLEAPSSM